MNVAAVRPDVPRQRTRARSCGTAWMMAARSRRSPSAINSFAITNIGPSRKCEGLSTRAGWRLLEHPMANHLEADAERDQGQGDRPHHYGACVMHDHCGSRKQHDRKAKNGCSERSVEQQPIDQHRQCKERRERRLHAPYLHGHQIERKNGGEKQCQNTEHMHRTIPGVAMIFHVIGKLALEKGIHGVARSLQPSRRNT